LIFSDSKKSSKLAPQAQGPCTIEHVRVNGTITLLRCNHLGLINIYPVHPYFLHQSGGYRGEWRTWLNGSRINCKGYWL